MSNRIVIEAQPLQTRVALVEDSVLTEYYVERPGRERLAGNIYKGRVANVLPGMEAAFVDVGLERNAFLYAGDVALNPEEFEFEGGVNPVGANRPTIRELVREGQELMVQVTKDPSGSKGARITTHITLPGRLLVLMPTVDYVGVSRRIEDESQREALKAEIEALRPSGMGVIVRTVAAEAEKEEMEEEINSLLTTWEQIQHELNRCTAPACLYRDSDLLVRAVRDMFSDKIDEMVVNDLEACNRIKSLASAFARIYWGASAIFRTAWTSLIIIRWRRRWTSPLPARFGSRAAGISSLTIRRR
jgi:ribonuclease G